MKATTFEAKIEISELMEGTQAGEEVIITSGPEKTPVAKMMAVKPQGAQRLGSMATPGWELGEAFWDPLPPGWDGMSE